MGQFLGNFIKENGGSTAKCDLQMDYRTLPTLDAIVAHAGCVVYLPIGSILAFCKDYNKDSTGL